LISKLEAAIRSADDYDLFRINPIRFAAERGMDESEAIDIFLHGTRAGLFEMDWHLVCAYCGVVVESLSELNLVHPQITCSFCSAETEVSLDDCIHVTFTISPLVRDIAFRHPDSLSIEDFHLRYLFSRGVIFPGGATVAEVGHHLTRFLGYLAPHEKQTVELDLDRGMLHAKNMKLKSSIVLFPHDEDPSAEIKSIPIEMIDNELHMIGADLGPRDVQDGTALFKYRLAGDISTGKVVMEVENKMDQPHPLWVLQYPAGFATAPVEFESFFSGKRLLTNQTFRNLFRAESVGEDEGIGVKEITFLFTDLKGSTAMYDQIGDPKAYYLVRQHFDTLGNVVARHSGAIVKTIGDAIMATFMSPRDAFLAAMDMIGELDEFNRSISEDLKLKVGIHTGHSIAVTLNERLDYFGQTVNIAARVQGLADGDEIFITHDAFIAPGMSETLAAYHVEPQQVAVKGVSDQLRVYKITA
jgi:class 3 adenylate cyclase